METGSAPEETKPVGRRRLAAIMFTDVAGSSWLMGHDEDHVMSLIRRDLSVIEDICEQYEGRVLKSMGDGCLAIFESGVHAVECAREIQSHFAEQSRALPKKEILEHRIGIHLGDVYLSDEDAMGDGVNIAARLQSEAPPGGICISQALYEVVKSRLSLKTVYQGPKNLKNIKDKVHLYEIVGFDELTQDIPALPKKTAFLKKRILSTIVVACVLIAVGIIVFKPSFTSSDTPDEVTEEFNRLDTNNDSILTIDEIPARFSERFMIADTDRNQEVSIEEFQALQDQLRQRDELQQTAFQQLDINGDQRIEPDELPASIRERFMRADLNRDGSVSLIEMKDALNRLRSFETFEQPEITGDIQPDGPIPNQGPSADRNPEDIFSSFDINNDNLVTMDELPEQGLERALRFDLNGDSIITEEEYYEVLSL